MKVLPNFILLALLAGVLTCCHTEDKKGFLHYRDISRYSSYGQNVNDWENVFSKPQFDQLDSIIREFEISTSLQVSIVTVGDASPYTTLKDFGNDLKNYWKQDKVRGNCDILIVFSAHMRNVWIGASPEVHNLLSDKVLQQIINTNMVPYFKQQDYFGGIESGLLQCFRYWVNGKVSIK